MKLKPILYLVIQFISFNAFSQEIVIKPGENISPYFSFEEWVYSNSNWGYDSYGLTSFEAHHSLFISALEKPPQFFIDGIQYNTQWLSKGLNTVPNLPLSFIDSVVVKRKEKFNRGFYTPNGSIEIYTKKMSPLLTFSTSLINEINDPGPNVSSDLKTENVDAVNYNESLILFYPKLLNTKFVYNRDRFSYTNRFTYDRELNFYRFRRTASKTPDGNSRFKRNIDQEFLLFNDYKNSTFHLRTLTSYIYSPEKYSWYALSGIEIPAKHKKIQSSFYLSPVNNSRFKQSQITVSYASTDSLPGTKVPKYGINETIISHTSSFLFPLNNSKISTHLNNTFFNWSDEVTGNNKSIHDVNLILGYNRDEDVIFNLTGGNYTLGFEYQQRLKKKLSLNLSSFRRNLNVNGFNATLWNEGLGFAKLNQNNHSVTNNSDFINTSTIAEISSGFSKKLYSFQWGVFSKHYWKYVHTDVEYRFKESGLQLDSDITYSDLNNIGFMGYNLFTRVSPTNKLLFKTSLSGHIFRYGDELFIGRAQNINRIMFSQSAQFRADKNAVFEIFYKYISPRDLVEFEPLESNPIFTTAHVRPIHLLNATAKIWMFDRALAMTLALRNLLNSTESYNTNGQYYNMSISVSASLAFGKN